MDIPSERTQATAGRTSRIPYERHFYALSPYQAPSSDVVTERRWNPKSQALGAFGSAGGSAGSPRNRSATRFAASACIVGETWL